MSFSSFPESLDRTRVHPQILDLDPKSTIYILATLLSCWAKLFLECSTYNYPLRFFLAPLLRPSGFFRVAFRLGLAVGLSGVERVVGQWISKGNDSGLSTGSNWEGVFVPAYSSSSKLSVTGSLSSSSSDELPDLLIVSSALLLVHSFAFLRASCLIDPSVDQLPRIVVPQLSVVGVAISYNPPTAHCSREAISSMLILGIASYSVGSNLLVGGVSSSGWAAGVGAGAGGCCPVDSRVGC